MDFSHAIVSSDDDTVRVDFGDRLVADGGVFHHRSIQDIRTHAMTARRR